MVHTLQEDLLFLLLLVVLYIAPNMLLALSHDLPLQSSIVMLKYFKVLQQLHIDVELYDYILK